MLAFGGRQGEVVVCDQYIGMLVEDMAVTARIFLVNLVVVALGHHYADTALGSREQCVMHGQQHVEALGRTREEQVAAQGDLMHIHPVTDVECLLPVGRKLRDVVLGYMNVIQQ